MAGRNEEIVDFELRAGPSGDGFAVIEVSGELDLAVADRLDDAIAATEEEIVAIDLSDCRFIDSTGLAVIVRAQQGFSKEGRRLLAASPSPQVLRLLEVTGLAGSDFLIGDLESLGRPLGDGSPGGP